MNDERPTDMALRHPTLAQHARPWLEARVLSRESLGIVDTLAGRWEETREDVLLVLALVVEAWARGHAGLWLDLGRARRQLPMPERDGEDREAVADPWRTTDATLFARVQQSPMVAHPGAGEAHRPFASVRPFSGAEGGSPSRPPPGGDLRGRGPALAEPGSAPPSADASSPRAPLEAPYGAKRGDVPSATPPPVLLQTRRVAWEEAAVADALVALAGPMPLDGDGLRIGSAEVEREVARFFPDARDGAGARALRIASTRRLTLVTGGPGTGKTWSIKRVLATLLGAAAQQGRALSVVLAAPTGKAAVRMREAMMEDLDQLTQAGVAQEVVHALRTLPASTLHALLRLRPRSDQTRFGPDAPLAADVIVVDEASMVDLPLMRKLLHAVAPTCRLILLGDRDQLPSVDVGSVLADVVSDALRGEGPLADNVARFDRNHRSGQSPTLAKLVATLQDPAADDNDAVALLNGGTRETRDPLHDRVRHLGSARDGRPTASDVSALVAPWFEDVLRDPHAPRSDGPPTVAAQEGYLAHLGALLRTGGRAAVAAAHVALLERFDRYRVLAVHRRGPLGVAGLTRVLGAEVRRRLLEAWAERPVREGSLTDDAVRTQRTAQGLPRARGLWLGQPVLVTENAPAVALYNGDIGLVLPSRTDPRTLVAVFPVVRLDKDTGALLREAREVPLPRLPPHEDALVLTVHKGQGSQYAHVAVVLADARSPIQTRELVYTGITRASERVTWYGEEAALRAALGTRVVRGSALGWRLRGGV